MNVYTLVMKLEHYSTIKETGLLTHVTTWNLHTIMFSEKAKGYMLYGSIYITYAVKNDRIVEIENRLVISMFKAREREMKKKGRWVVAVDST